MGCIHQPRLHASTELCHITRTVYLHETTFVHGFMGAPDVKDAGCGDGRSVDVVAGLVQKHLEVTDDGVGPLPAPPHATGLGGLDPALARSANAMVDVNARGELGCRERGDRLVSRYAILMQMLICFPLSIK